MEAMELEGDNNSPPSHMGVRIIDSSRGELEMPVYNWMFRGWRANWLRCLLRHPPRHPFFSFILTPPSFLPIPSPLVVFLYLFYSYIIQAMAKARRNFSFKFLLALRFSFFPSIRLYFSANFLFPFSLLELSHGFVYLFFFCKVFICFVLQNSMCVFPSKISRAMFQLKTPPLKHFSATFCFSHSFRVERFLSLRQKSLEFSF